MALLLGGLLLGEEVNTKMIGGFVLVILGVVIANWRCRQAKTNGGSA